MGIIPYEAGVGAIGNAAYTIPIEVVPGTKGMQPNLSVEYNSTAGTGLLGESCVLKGISAIQRTGKTPFLDHSSSSVSLDYTDRFMLNGNRLVCLDPTAYGLDGTTYYPEFEDHSTIVSYGQQGDGPLYFKVFLDDGSVVEYGYSQDSRQTVGTTVLNWYVSKITDSHGNYMTYHYGNSGSEIWIDHIDYTGNVAAGLNPYARVLFEYTTGIHIGSSFVAGNEIRQEHLLSNIKVQYYDGTGYENVRQYIFAYTDDTPKRLSNVQLAAADGTVLNPTLITWNTATYGSVDTITRLALPMKYEESHIVADIDKDGFCDIVEKESTKVQFLRNSGNGFVDAGTLLADTEHGWSVRECLPADIDGDGFSEVLTVFKKGKKFFTTSSHYTNGLLQTTLFGDTMVFTNDIRQIYTGAFFGNDRQQLLFADNTGYVCAIGMEYGSTSVADGSSEDGSFYLLDIDGDGQLEFAVPGRFLSLYHYDDDRFTLLRRTTLPSGIGIVAFSDFNGDGISDMLYHDNSDPKNVYKVAFGNGIGFTYGTPLDVAPYQRCNTLPLQVADINNDGLADILTFTENTAGVQVRHYLSRGYYGDTLHFLYDNTIYLQQPYLFTSTDPSHPILLGDFNGDSRLDIAALKSALEYYSRVFIYDFRADGQRCQVGRVTAGDASYRQWHYKNIQGVCSRYSSYFHTPPYHFCVVDTLTATGGQLSQLHHTTYSFENPMYSYRRRQIMGFAKTVTTDLTRHLSDTVWSENQMASLGWQDVLMPVRKKTKKWNTLVSTVEYTPRCILLALNRRFLAIEEEIATDLLEGSLTRTSRLYNGYGRLAKQTVEVRDTADVNFLTKDSVEYFYLSIPLSSGATATVTDSIAEMSFQRNSSLHSISEEKFSYNSRAEQISHTSNTGGNTITETVEVMDLFGNVRRSALSAEGCDTRTSSVFYDNTGRFVVTATNPIGHYAWKTYDPATGLVLTEKDANMLTTSYSYDPFGRVDTVWYPDNTMKTISRKWYTDSEIPGARYRIVTKTTGLSNTEQYLDLAGREVCIRKNGFYHDTRYNSDGTIYRTSAPYLRGALEANKIWHTYGYDLFGRLSYETAPYTDLSYSYSGRTTTVHDNLRQTNTVRTLDAAGRVVSATDPGGTIQYNYGYEVYDDQTVLRSNVSVGGHTTTVLTSQSGNRLLLADPDADTTRYAYNAFGELVRQVDARGDTTTLQYDLIGRVTQKRLSGPAGETHIWNYAYDPFSTTNRGRGQLHYIQYDGNTAEFFTYDALGRPSQHTRYIDGTSYTESQTYNANGQTDTLTFPDGFAIRYEYNDKGLLETVTRTSDSKQLYKVYSRNLYLQPTRCGYGNGTATDYEYNTFGMLTRINTGIKIYQQNPDHPDLPDFPPVVGPLSFNDPPMYEEYNFDIDSTIQNLHYSYDAVGRLAQRTQKNSQYETFQYDNLNRLTSFSQGTLNGAAQTSSTTYDLQGNITGNTLAGTYQYDSDKPHAVTSITPSADFPDAIPASQCETEYNLFNQPSQITEGDLEVLLEYGQDGQRVKAVFKRNGVVERTRYYISANYEKEVDAAGVTTHYNYIYGANGLAALCVRRNEVDSLYYVHPDRLGSYTHITNGSKQVIRALHFDPWGNVKTDTNWTVFDTTSLAGNLAGTFRFDRGFTGHEHYADLKIINMNGRLYDPVIARFFSPDNFVQAPDFTQSFNRYSYCLNNPLQYVDPSGESFIALGFAIGAMVNVISQMITGNINSASDFLFSAFIGGIAGVVSGAAGSAAMSAAGVGGFLGGAASGAASGAAGGFIAGTGNALVGGNDFGTALGYGWLGGVAGALFGGLTGGLASGITDAIHGYNFWDGSFYEEFATGEVVANGDYVAIADYYNNSSIAGKYDAYLINRYKEMFGVQTGDYNIVDITSRPYDFGKRCEMIGMNDNWQFVKIEDNYIVGGFVTGNSVKGTHIHISPATISDDDVVFRALAGHELLHSYHHYLGATMGYPYNHNYSEYAAYQYTYNVYSSNLYYYKALKTMVTAYRLNYWSTSYPFFYNFPF
ncbi:MAG: VCBS repeat-containing protein [Bacteroidales bacterium]|nr:VCBS repeat-containing protein [Bacteroidales bacterium]